MVTPPVTRSPEDVPAPAAAAPRRRRVWRRLPRYTWSGTTGALLAGCSSLTPSLLPRGWLVQGIVGGITAAIGYGLGATIAWFVPGLTQTRVSPGFRPPAGAVAAALGPRP